MRDLFQRGVASQPSIIFIDELDALAKVRGGINSNDEREQTLNQLLTEMDGFDSEVMAARGRVILRRKWRARRSLKIRRKILALYSE